eukprot:4565950-Prymnesium_polylepis.1
MCIRDRPHPTHTHTPELHARAVLPSQNPPPPELHARAAHRARRAFLPPLAPSRGSRERLPSPSPARAAAS